MMNKIAALFGLFGMAVATATGGAAAQDQIRMVGSSTVFPFATAAAEEFGNNSSFKTPIVEATGTGGGLKLFCAGIGAPHPDMVNASRRIKQAELDTCAANGVSDVIELKIGLDGIVVAAAKDAPTMQFSLKDLYLALAAKVPAPGTQGGTGHMVDNPYRLWSEVNPALPAREILVLGPPPTSGTRDAFNELAIEAGCNSFEGMSALKTVDGQMHKILCRSIREDGVFVEAGENDNLIVQKIQGNSDAVGVFGFSFMEQNADLIQAFPIATGGAAPILPSFESIADRSYPITRSLFVYIKKAHVGVIPGLREFMQEIVSDRAAGEFGYLTDRGLIPLPDGERRLFEDTVENLTPVSLD